MSGLVRFGVSLEKTLLDGFDVLIRAKQYTNRSEALRDLIRRELVEREWQGGAMWPAPSRSSTIITSGTSWPE
ncbi:MAG: ribbon-helix-helix protein, CopG family [Syntrophales bacterium]|nr:ribbon-helix-helix protein, CopG family [Syntrophales bacterium]